MFKKILKFNPFHDEKGRFTHADGAKFISTGPKFAKTISRLKAQKAKAEAAYSKKEFKPIDQRPSALNRVDDEYMAATAAQYDKLSDVQKAMLKNYTGSGYTLINKALGGDPHAQTGMARVMGKNLDEALDSMTLPEDTVLFRAVNAHRLLGITHNGYADNFDGLKALEGKTLVDPSFGSTSTDIDIASAFKTSQRVFLAIKAPKGTKGAWVGDNNGDFDNTRSQHPTEHEFVMPRDRVYKVEKVSSQRSKHGSEYTTVEVSLLNPYEKPATTLNERFNR